MSSRMDRIRGIQVHNAEADGRKQLAYERGLVKMVLKRLSIQPIDLAMRNAYSVTDASIVDTFGWMNHVFPDFPVYITCQEVKDPDITEFMRNRGKANEVWGPWKELVSSYKVGKPIAMTFKMSITAHLGPMVMHNVPHHLLTHERACMQSNIGGDMVSLEYLDTFINWVGTQWRLH